MEILAEARERGQVRQKGDREKRVVKEKREKEGKKGVIFFPYTISFSLSLRENPSSHFFFPLFPVSSL